MKGILTFLIVIICLSSKAQGLQTKELYTINNRKQKKELPQSENDKEKITALHITFYQDSIFPNDYMLSLPNIEEIGIEMPTIPSHTLKKTPQLSVRFDTLKLKQLSKVKIVTMYHVKFDSFPTELAQIAGLEELNLLFNNLKTIPASIEKFRHVKSMDFSGNDIEFVHENFKNLENITKVDFANNGLKYLPFCVLENSSIEEINFIDTKGTNRQGLNENSIDYLNDIDKLKNVLEKSNLKRLSLQFENSLNEKKFKTLINDCENKNKIYTTYKMDY